MENWLCTTWNTNWQKAKHAVTEASPQRNTYTSYSNTAAMHRATRACSWVLHVSLGVSLCNLAESVGTNVLEENLSLLTKKHSIVRLQENTSLIRTHVERFQKNWPENATYVDEARNIVDVLFHAENLCGSPSLSCVPKILNIWQNLCQVFQETFYHSIRIFINFRPGFSTH